MAAGNLVLRDVHTPAEPSWWPPAPGWWLLMGLLVVLIGLVWLWRARREARRRAIEAIFDEAVADTRTPAEQVARMSELLRRAGRRRDPGADRLAGERWLEFLDGRRDGQDAANERRRGVLNWRKSQPGNAPAAGRPAASRPFSEGPGRLLLEGAYRRDTDPDQVAALKQIARQRFLQWMARK